jgi:hypothetical protein
VVVSALRNDEMMTSRGYTPRWWNDEQDVLAHIEDELRSMEMPEGHVKAWRKVGAIESYSEWRKKADALIDSWLDSQWTTTISGRKITGTLRTVQEYALDGEPAFTIECVDPDYPSGFPLTVTGHFSRFEPK